MKNHRPILLGLLAVAWLSGCATPKSLQEQSQQSLQIEQISYATSSPYHYCNGSVCLPRTQKTMRTEIVEPVLSSVHAADTAPLLKVDDKVSHAKPYRKHHKKGGHPKKKVRRYSCSPMEKSK